jgi:hypothetical protein
MLTILLVLSLQQAPLPLDAPRVSTEKRLVEIDFAMKSLDPVWPTRGVVAVVTGYSVFVGLGAFDTALFFMFFDAELTAATAAAVNAVFITAAVLSGLGLILGTGALIWSAIQAGDHTAQKRRLLDERATLMGTGTEFRRPADAKRF